jgi:isochorismate hydrolase
MISMPLDDHLKLLLSGLITWLSMVQPAFEEAHICEDIDFYLEDALADELELEHAIALQQEL